MFGHSHGLDGGSLAPNQKVTFKSCSPCLAEILQGQHRSVEGLSNRRIGKNSFMSQFSQKAYLYFYFNEYQTKMYNPVMIKADFQAS